MGAANSKEERVYVYANQIPLGLTPKLEQGLAKASSRSSSSSQAAPVAAEPTHKDAAPAGEMNSLDLARLVDEEVGKELARILEKQQMDGLQAKERQASSAEMLSEMRDIAQQINNGSAATRSAAFEKSIDARNRVSECLRDNADRPLNCWKAVGDFRALVGVLESEHVASCRQ
ncbi:hypothetical protein LPJ72_001112 [Coemansia sp. Benny D160-2]|nr:hypothetical protein LPJ72_001112 [Coemansia sp. Benny D160-2]